MFANCGPMLSAGGLQSSWSMYRVLGIVGKGMYGRVAKCRRMDTNKTVAVKMIKNQNGQGKGVNQEVAVLQKLKRLDSDKCNLVQWNNVFADMHYIYLEFEYLDKSLFDLMTSRSFKPLTLKEIRPVVHQLANALDHLKAVAIIHADLKLENVMLVNHARQPYKIKLIDFSLSGDVSAAKPGAYIQSRWYRSPEILLGHPYTEAIDMWSLGCVAAVLYMGAFLYNGKDEYEMMRVIVQTQGQPPDSILDSGGKTSQFFQKVYNPSARRWKLKTPEQYYHQTGHNAGANRRYRLSSLDRLLHFQPKVFNSLSPLDEVAETTDVRLFVDMLKGMLHLDASKRLTPLQVLDHRFCSMRHFVSFRANSSHVKSCYELMSVCEKSVPTSDCQRRSGAMSLTQQPLSQTAQRTIPPAVQPSTKPTAQPTTKPTVQPTTKPTVQPTTKPTVPSTAKPTVQPTPKLTVQPTIKPTVQHNTRPTLQHNTKPLVKPSIQPTAQPTIQPTVQPTIQPTAQSTIQPTVQPTAWSTAQPTIQPAVQPTVKHRTWAAAQPTMWTPVQPVVQPTIKCAEWPTVQTTIQSSIQPPIQPPIWTTYTHAAATWTTKTNPSQLGERTRERKLEGDTESGDNPSRGPPQPPHHVLNPQVPNSGQTQTHAQTQAQTQAKHRGKRKRAEGEERWHKVRVAAQCWTSFLDSQRPRHPSDGSSNSSSSSSSSSTGSCPG